MPYRSSPYYNNPYMARIAGNLTDAIFGNAQTDVAMAQKGKLAAEQELLEQEYDGTEGLSGYLANALQLDPRMAASHAVRGGMKGDDFAAYLGISSPEHIEQVLAATGKLKPDVAVSIADRESIRGADADYKYDEAMDLQGSKNRANAPAVDAQAAANYALADMRAGPQSDYYDAMGEYNRAGVPLRGAQEGLYGDQAEYNRERSETERWKRTQEGIDAERSIRGNDPTAQDNALKVTELASVQSQVEKAIESNPMFASIPRYEDGGFVDPEHEVAFTAMQRMAVEIMRQSIEAGDPIGAPTALAYAMGQVYDQEQQREPGFGWRDVARGLTWPSPLLSIPEDPAPKPGLTPKPDIGYADVLMQQPPQAPAAAPPPAAVAPPAPAPSAVPAPAPAPQAAAPPQLPTPRTDADIQAVLDAANRAIRERGADPEAVAERLRAMGIDFTMGEAE